MSQLLHSLALVLCTDIQQFIVMKQKLEVERENKGRLINRMYLSFMLTEWEERGFTCVSHILAQFLCGIHTFLELSNYFIKKKKREREARKEINWGWGRWAVVMEKKMVYDRRGWKVGKVMVKRRKQDSHGKFGWGKVKDENLKGKDDWTWREGSEFGAWEEVLR